MKRIKLLIAVFAVAVLGAFAFIPVSTAGAIDPLGDVCSQDPGSEICQHQDEDAESLIGTLVNVLLFLVGALAVVMIIWSGIQYVISTGDAGKIAKAKNTLMYSVVGLVIAFISFALVNWVFDLF